eukprot:TRINITY_DN13673_c0_g1_i1.p1 TRINITY_DN13673_c0_g1~~TRINITY_DN13673_c0_g1_i1.p1  ORF type:complete len:172 (-),score=7.49 TRINITY_DN13673_c0_g1_i1:362-877(-)
MAGALLRAVQDIWKGRTPVTPLSPDRSPHTPLRFGSQNQKEDTAQPGFRERNPESHTPATASHLRANHTDQRDSNNSHTAPRHNALPNEMHPNPTSFPCPAVPTSPHLAIESPRARGRALGFGLGQGHAGTSHSYCHLQILAAVSVESFDDCAQAEPDSGLHRFDSFLLPQ